MNDNTPWRELNRLFAELSPRPVVGSPQWWVSFLSEAGLTSEDWKSMGAAERRAYMRLFGPGPRRAVHQGEWDYDGDGGREWEENDQDNKGRRSG